MNIIESIINIDLWLNQYIVGIWGLKIDYVMNLITTIGNPVSLTLLSTCLLAALLYKKKIYYFIISIFSLIGAFASEALIKITVGRARPINALIDVSGYSFPSGHATMATVFFLLIIYLYENKIKNTYLRALFISSNVFLFLIIGFSRIYLGVHWLSDVIAGTALGIFWFTFTILLKRTIEYSRFLKH